MTAQSSLYIKAVSFNIVISGLASFSISAVTFYDPEVWLFLSSLSNKVITMDQYKEFVETHITSTSKENLYIEITKIITKIFLCASALQICAALIVSTLAKKDRPIRRVGLKNYLLAPFMVVMSYFYFYLVLEDFGHTGVISSEDLTGLSYVAFTGPFILFFVISSIAVEIKSFRNEYD